LVFAVIAAILILISSSLVAHDISPFSGVHHPIYDKLRAGVVSIMACYSLVRFLAVQGTLSQ